MQIDGIERMVEVLQGSGLRKDSAGNYVLQATITSVFFYIFPCFLLEKSTKSIILRLKNGEIDWRAKVLFDDSGVYRVLFTASDVAYNVGQGAQKLYVSLGNT